MAYFNRLTDIVTCRLTGLLDQESDRHAALEGIISEMEEGLAGARRSLKTASANEERLEGELEEHCSQIAFWRTQAKDLLSAGQEDQARLALFRKNEVTDLVAGLQQQLEAAAATREHLTTMLRAIEARLAEARRKQKTLQNSVVTEEEAKDAPSPIAPPDLLDESRSRQVEEELEALRQELASSAPISASCRGPVSGPCHDDDRGSPAKG